uniref:RING-type domain-containing protein n=1 Tax=Ananas comosus var. bracteatus TaxID=296719 RepID=A0A6V7PGP9_ANACO|nr:unnamed protein product [Ananas comosus var. bracteatus]
MGFEGAEKGGVEGGGGEEVEKAESSCSICLEAVEFEGGRSTARLQCGHEFHLDCIGSAFNAKGLMQCPNCRKVEKGNWRFANGYRPPPDVNIDEWTNDEDLYDPGYSEIPFPWIHSGRVGQAPPVLESSEWDWESPLPVNFHEHVATSGATDHPCPYETYILQPSSSSSSTTISSSNSHHSSERDGHAYFNQWTQMPEQQMYIQVISIIMVRNAFLIHFLEF